jgi:hypothetical protein
MDVVGGIGLTDGTTAKALTGLDDHSRFCVADDSGGPIRPRDADALPGQRDRLDRHDLVE